MNKYETIDAIVAETPTSNTWTTAHTAAVIYTAIADGRLMPCEKAPAGFFPFTLHGLEAIHGQVYVNHKQAAELIAKSQEGDA